MPRVYKRPKRYTEDHDFLLMVARLIRRAGERTGTADMDEFRQLVDLHESVDDAIARAVPGLRDAGYSWTAIGEAVGITRQAAQQRFGRQVQRRQGVK